VRAVTPVVIYNRPGLDSLAYRVGTHGRFLATMQAQLATATHPGLVGLRTRDPDDLSMAVLDGWAAVADVLTFYQERIANEGYLRTATERRSVLELARLVGYRPRPGLSATAFLAFTVEAGHELTVPVGTRAQSVPGPGQLPQIFETADPVVLRGEWSTLPVRRTRPQHITHADLATPSELVLAGAVGSIKRGDVLVADLTSDFTVLDVTAVAVDPATGATTASVTPRANPVLSILAAGSFAALRAQLLPPARFGVKKKDAAPALALIEALGTDGANDAAIVSTLRDGYARASTDEMTPVAAWLRLVVEAAEQVVRGRGEGDLPGPGDGTDERSELGKLVSVLRKPPSLPPASERELRRDVASIYATASGGLGSLVEVLVPEVRETLTAALAHATAPDPTPVAFDRMGVRAALFGHNAPLLPRFDSSGNVVELIDPLVTPIPTHSVPVVLEAANKIYTPSLQLALDAVYDAIQPGATIVISNPTLNPTTTTRTVAAVATATKTIAGVSGRVTDITLGAIWPTVPVGTTLANDVIIRQTVVLAGEQPLTLAPLPVDHVDVDGDVLELDGLYPDLGPGRWVVVAGERTDEAIAASQQRDDHATGVPGVELAMIASVEQRTARLDDATVRLAKRGAATPAPNLPGDVIHTFVRLAQPLAFSYRRPSVVLYGNVVRATQGDSKAEVLGAGDGTKRSQRFNLKQPPLTYVPAPTAVGAASTLSVEVNDVRWHEVEDFLGAGQNDHSFVLRTDDAGQTSVVFGDGVRGARLPTGQENVQARYRSGLGRSGNVAASRISLLISKPLGVKEVVNPLPATGGADREGRDQARQNAPTAVQALDRLVSVQDYGDFSRVFAGVGKASARELSAGGRQLVHVTIAGVDDQPIATSSDLFRNLRRALHDLGDPFEPVELAVRELRLLVIVARVRIDPDHRWEKVEAAVRAALLDAFGADRRELGQDVVEAEVLRTMQATDGVVYVDLQTLDSLGIDEVSRPDPASELSKRARVAARLARPDRAPGRPAGALLPAELLILSPDVPDTLILSELVP